jgi:hypothetical protein
MMTSNPHQNAVHEPPPVSASEQHDLSLITRLERANFELRTLFFDAEKACRNFAFDAAADALNRCMHKLREVQRVESLRLHPVLADQAGDSNSAATIAYLRLRVHTLARRFLRLCEQLMMNCRAHSPQPEHFAEASKALDDYINAKELQLYQAYCFTQASP